jgi:hypothetical protein
MRGTALGLPCLKSVVALVLGSQILILFLMWQLTLRLSA